MSDQAGLPALVLGNSLGTSRAVWDGEAQAFLSSFRLLQYDFPGHGGSAAAPGPYTIAALGRAVLGLLDARGVDRAAYCGISLGGMVGMWLAANAPDRITALGLVCTSAYLPPAEGWQARADQVRSDGMASIAAPVVGRWFTPQYAAGHPSVVSSFRAELERTDAEGYAGCCEAIAAMDLRGLLPKITAPTLVLAGAEDPAIPPEHGAAIAAGIAGARFDCLPGAAHLATVSADQAVTSALLSHLRGR
jgi:3-oxoadipate enol-lactonase